MNLSGIGAHQRTFVELLRDAGYDCVSFGSNHLQPEPGGFRKLVSSRHRHPESSYRRSLAGLNLEADPEEIDPSTATRSSPPFGLLTGDMAHLSDAYSTGRAVEYLGAQPESPFFLYLGLHLPHPPYTADRKHFEMYEPSRISIADFRDPGIRLHPKLQNTYDASNYGALVEEDVRMVTALYLAMVTFVDEQVSRILAALRDAGLETNTHVVFTSDHADFCGEMGMYVKVDLPIRSLTHVPLLWLTPEHTAGQADRFSEGVDLAPTFLRYAGVESPYDLEGKHLLDGGRGWARADSGEGRYNDRTQRYERESWYTSYVDREWHYIHSTRPDHCTLYSLAEDPHCHQNVLGMHAEKADELRTRLLDHLLLTSIAHQDNSLPNWQEYHGGTGTYVRAWG